MTTLSPRLLALLTLPPLLWAGNAVVGRLMVGQVPPLTLNFLRWALTLLLLAPLALRTLGPWRQLRERWRYLLAIGVLGVGLFNSLQYLALVTSTPLNVTLVNSSMAVWMLVVGRIFFGERAGGRQWAGAALGLAGVLVVIGRGSLQTLLNVHFVPGDLFTLAATIGWAGYSWLLARPPAHMRGSERPAWDWAAFLWVQVLFGLLAAGNFTAGEHLLTEARVHWSGGVVAALLYVSLAASIVAYRAWGLGVAEGGPALAAFFNNLTPLFAALLSALLLGEAPRPFHAVAFGLIVGGIAVSTSRRPSLRGAG